MLDIIIISIVTILLAYLSYYYVDKLYRPFLILLISILYIPLGAYLGLSLNQMGLSFNFDYKWLILLLSLIAVVLFTLILATKITFVNKIYLKQISKHSNKDSLTTQSLRVILLTALPEEIIFRGVLLGLFYINYSMLVSVFFSSFIFYLWHIPEYTRIKETLDFKTIAANTLPTFFAGLAFNIIRLLTGGIFFGWAIHSFLNISGLIFARYVSESSRK